MAEKPSSDDIADTLSASYKTMRKLEERMEGILGFVFVLEILVALLCGVATFYLLQQMRSHQ